MFLALLWYNECSEFIAIGVNFMLENDANITSLLQVISQLNDTIKRFDTTVKELQETVKKQEAVIADKDKYIQTLTEAINHMRREMYGSKSEKTRLL